MHLRCLKRTLVQEKWFRLDWIEEAVNTVGSRTRCLI